MTAVIEEQLPSGTPGSARPRSRVLLAGLLLLAAYVGASLLCDPGGYLGTDTGGKVLTLEAMARRGDLVPDVGYWAAAEDPDAGLHPAYYTSRVGEHYVNVTTLPMVIAAEPLYRVGGYRLALLVPMLAAVAVAYAARALARRLGASDRTAWWAFWLVGLASPVFVYALDFWEHAPGLACMAWAVVVALDAIDDPRLWRGLLVGALFGAAATMRTESMVYALVTGVALAIALVRSKPAWGRVLGCLAGVAAGGVAVLAANEALERVLLGASLRSGRAAGAATGGGAGLAVRLREGMITTFGLFPSDATGDIVLGVLLVVFVVVAITTWRSRHLVAVAFLSFALILFALRLVAGVGFVPGLLIASPVAILGALQWSTGSRTRFVLGVAGAALPVVWLFQYTGGAAPQWGGRYVLLSGLLATVVGVVNLERVERPLRVALVAMTVLVTVLGVGWLAVRSHRVADFARQLEARREPVVISTADFLLRETGPAIDGRAWLSTTGRKELPAALAIAQRRGYDEVALLERGRPAPPEVDGWTVVGRQRLDLFDPGDMTVFTLRHP